MRFETDGEDKQGEKAYRETLAALKRAAKATITKAGERLLREARADLSANGFGGPRWRESLKLGVYPKGSATSINSVAFLSAKPGYLGVFETGSEIKGRPLLWVPLPGVPKQADGQSMTAKKYAAQHGKMFLIRGPSGKPVLAQRKGKQLIPLFVGLDSVSIRKRLHVGQIADRIRGDLPQMFEAEVDKAI